MPQRRLQPTRSAQDPQQLHTENQSTYLDHVPEGVNAMVRVERKVVLDVPHSTIESLGRRLRKDETEAQPPTTAALACLEVIMEVPHH